MISVGLCELCLRYGVKTPVDGKIKRRFDCENVRDRTNVFNVCASCAGELDQQEGRDTEGDQG